MTVQDEPLGAGVGSPGEAAAPGAGNPLMHRPWLIHQPLKGCSSCTALLDGVRVGPTPAGHGRRLELRQSHGTETGA